MKKQILIIIALSAVQFAFAMQNSPLVDAARDGNLLQVMILLAQGMNPEQENQQGTTALIWAAERGNLPLVELLIRDGAKINYFSNGRNATALILAAENGRLDVVRALLKNDADVDLANQQGMTPLYMACHNGHLAVALLLIENKASINHPATTGTTPLIIAAQKGFSPIETLLLNKGVPINQQNNAGFTALMMAAAHRHLTSVEVLLGRGANPNLCALDSANRLSALYLAAQNGYPRIAELLLKHGALVDLANIRNVTPLLIACEFNHAEVVKILLRNHAQPNAQSTRGTTALIISTINENIEIIKLLLSNGAQLDIADPEEKTPLVFAAEGGDEQVMQALLTTIPLSEYAYIKNTFPAFSHRVGTGKPEFLSKDTHSLLKKEIITQLAQRHIKRIEQLINVAKAHTPAQSLAALPDLNNPTTYELFHKQIRKNIKQILFDKSGK
jgi:ankyrin repeat protein